ncbi:glycosyltransferase family 2 protein [Mucilaginibacter pocheonensis]|uniref:Glycosyltransferase involved in cell wall biosynthesis n=1 Tax=Mucilaginibacter pocheonensis TaxID=398050 RepID=A0ABU1T9R8_9SPHI|nr:glycosyltransferase family 2 protein [Mucilaginibacter pocheonensis]MDR6942153.1 glycosyltransferase involved in cell wall biosynthesis [Mucilaginibacter pocheonensis]
MQKLLKQYGMMMRHDLMVSICCITYNQERFIGQAIESFMMQQTDFQFEIVIGNDCSKDGTAAVVESFIEKYPGKIRMLTNEKNVGCHHNMINTLKVCKGKYIALCEGDDYWTDPNKLQKQVDFLENNPEYIICCHYTKVVDTDNNTLYVNPKPSPLVHTYYDLLTGKQEETKTATVLYHNVPEVHQLFQKPWYFACFAGDKMLKLYATFNTGLSIYVMPEVMSCYRNHVDGIWSMIKVESRMEMMISDFNLIIKHFSYPAFQKKKLLLLYVKRYILFELARFRIRKAYDTVKYLL